MIFHVFMVSDMRFLAGGMPRIDGGRYEACSSSQASYFPPVIQGFKHRMYLVSPSVDTRPVAVVRVHITQQISKVYSLKCASYHPVSIQGFLNGECFVLMFPAGGMPCINCGQYEASSSSEASYYTPIIQAS